MNIDKQWAATAPGLRAALTTSLILGSTLGFGCDAGGIVTLTGTGGGDAASSGGTGGASSSTSSSGSSATTTSSSSSSSSSASGGGTGGTGGSGGASATGTGGAGASGGTGGSGGAGTGGAGGSGGAGGGAGGSGGGLDCVGGTTLCGDLCKDLLNDEDNCGECGLECAFEASCVVGLCSEAPEVVSTVPQDGAFGVALDRRIEVVFDSVMDPLTIDASTFTVTDGASSIAGEVTYAGFTAAFTPDVDYPTDTLLTATITTAAEDLSGQGLAQDYVWTFETGDELGVREVDLGDASPYAILAFNTVTNVDSVGTIVTGDLGISPGSALTGFPPGIVIGTIHVGDVEAADAKTGVLDAYQDAAGRLGAAVLPADLSGLTFPPGVYANAGAVMLTAGDVTLDAQGDVNAVFILRSATTLTTSPNTAVVLSGGAQARNVFWAVGTSATIGTNADFAGTIVAQTAVTMNTGAALNGRALAIGAAVTLDTNLITVP